MLIPPPTTCWAPVQNSPVSAQCQLSVNWYQLVSSWLPLQSVKKSPLQVTIQGKWLFAVSGSPWHWQVQVQSSQHLWAEQLLCLFSVSASGLATPCHIPTYTGISRDNPTCNLCQDILV